MSPMPRVRSEYWLLLIAILLTAAVYWPGLYGGWLFDDYPNIVDNPGVQPHDASIPALVRAALSSPASDFKRPLASLSFAANYLIGGLDPRGWKLTNLVLHLLNGLLVFVLAKALMHCCAGRPAPGESSSSNRPINRVALLIATGWMLLPINLTAVLYVVQREESLANLFVLLGLIGYTAGRQRMLAIPSGDFRGWHLEGFAICFLSLAIPTCVGLLAKETAVMLPLYALLIEWIVFKFDRPAKANWRIVTLIVLAVLLPWLLVITLLVSLVERVVLKHIRPGTAGTGKDWHIAILFVLVLLLPMAIGAAWLLPHMLNADTWATRDFTLYTRLLSEARIVCNYIAWILLPTPGALSFYHDQFRASSGFLSPWTTLAGLFGLTVLVILMFRLRRRHPLPALGIGLYLGCHLLTGTILPLELVYEHRNYFASFGILLVVIPFLTALPSSEPLAGEQSNAPLLPLPRRALLGCLLLWWAGLTAMTANAWSDPLWLAQELAARAPDSPRAQYELGRTYIIYSHYDRASPYTQLAYAPLERAAALPNSSILPQQALIFMNSRMQLPIDDRWWNSMIERLRSTQPTVQDESSLQALVQCLRDRGCEFPTSPLNKAFQAALSHPNPSARLLAVYSDFAWSQLNDQALGERMIKDAIRTAPNEPAYLITWTRMLIVKHRISEARLALQRLETLNIGGRLSGTIDELRNQMQDTP